MIHRGFVFGLLMLGLLVGGFAGLAHAADADGNQKACPVSGEPIDKSAFADFDGKRVYFCCPGCMETFKGDATQRIKELEASGVVFAQAGSPQTHCPIMGGKIDKAVFVDHDGKRVYFCCPGCIGKFNEDAAGHIKKMEIQGIRLDPTPKPQTHCPIMGGEIDKTVFVDHGGQRVYFCCPGCIGKFNEDPDGYIRKLEDQGFTLASAECQEDHDHEKSHGPGADRDQEHGDDHGHGHAGGRNH